VLVVTTLLLSSLLFPGSFGLMHRPRHMEAFVGQPGLFFRLTAVYLVGCCFYLFRHRIAFRPMFAVIATVTMAVFFVFAPARAELGLVLCGGYLMFYLGQMDLPWLSGMKRFPDISYGIYLYGWPVESLWIWFQRGSPWIAFLGSTVICFCLGWLSWHFIERPALTLKRNATAPLTVA
jgi:peptidoglycan/LPS O-acetylase OafA/YrhL